MERVTIVVCYMNNCRLAYLHVCVCVCVLCVGSLINDLYPPPPAVADFGLRRTGVLYKQTSKQETASRVELGPLRTDWAVGGWLRSGGGGAEAKGMGDVQMDAGISERRFIISPAWMEMRHRTRLM